MAMLVLTYNNATGQIIASTLGASQIATGAVLSSQLGSGQVGDGHLYPGSVISSKIGAAIIANPHLMNQGILSSAIGANILATPHIQNQGILSASIGAAVLGGVHLYSGSIAGTNLANALATSSKIASGIVGIPHLQPWASGKILVGQGTGVTPITEDKTGGVEFVIGDSISLITSGAKGYLEMPFPGIIARCTVLANTSGNINLDIWKKTFTGFPGIAATDSICSSWRPHTSGAMTYQDSILSNWVKSLASGDVLACYTNAASSIAGCTLSLLVYR